MTQLQSAREGIVTEEMKYVAAAENAAASEKNAAGVPLIKEVKEKPAK